MNDLPKVPIIDLPGSEGWSAGYEWGEKIDAAFPGQDGDQFGIACQYNGHGPTENQQIIGFVMLKQGEHDGADWRWRVTLADGTAWFAEGGCDYTGWDCQSSLDWTQDDTGLPDLVRQALTADSTEQSDEAES